MRTFFTTEQELINILASCEDNVWKDVVKKQHHVFVSLPSGRVNWDENNRLLSAFHRSGKKIYAYPDFFEKIKNDQEIMTKLSTPIYLLDITNEEAEEISREYGICCYAIGTMSKPFIVKRGWDIETTDVEKPNSWDYFYKDIHSYCNSIVIIDRYLFSCEFNKKNGEPNEVIQDSYANLEQIMNNILPKESKCKDFTLTIIFSCSTISGGLGEKPPKFSEIIEEVQNIKERIGRPFDFNIEIVSIDRGCAYYNDTHDRFIITNYSITEASHKLKAYRTGGISLCKQKLYFDYTYSKGIEEGDKSSLPATTQERVLNALQNYIRNRKNRKKIKYAFNGVEYPLQERGVSNKLLTERF